MQGAWVAQSAKNPTHDFHSGHGLGVMESSPESGSGVSMESAWDSPWDSLCLSPHSHELSFILSLKYIKSFLKKSNLLSNLFSIDKNVQTITSELDQINNTHWRFGKEIRHSCIHSHTVKHNNRIFFFLNKHISNKKLWW